MSSGQVGAVGSDAAEPTASEWVLYAPNLGRSGLHASVWAHGCSDLVAAHFALLFLICHAFLPRVRRRGERWRTRKTRGGLGRGLRGDGGVRSPFWHSTAIARETCRWGATRDKRRGYFAQCRPKLLHSVPVRRSRCGIVSAVSRPVQVRTIMFGAIPGTLASACRL